MISIGLTSISGLSSYVPSSSSTLSLLVLSQVLSLLVVQKSRAEGKPCADMLVSCPCGPYLSEEVDVPIKTCHNYTFGWFFPKLKCVECQTLIPEATCRDYEQCEDCRHGGSSECIPYKKGRQIQKNHCPRPLYLPNGYITTSKEPVPGSVVKYRCSKHHLLIGNFKRTCGKDFRWSGSHPKCLESMCSRPDGIQNGRIQFKENQLVFNVGDRVLYTCHADYVIVGQSSRICGVDSKWSGSKPFCIEVISCEDPGKPKGAERVEKKPIGSTLQDAFPVGTVLSFKCPKYYELYGSANRKCTPTKEWTGRQPTCVPVCGKIEIPIENIDNILNGNAYRREAFPWNVAISTDVGLSETLLRCGGTLITDQWVVTAAHCVAAGGTKDSLPLRQITVYISKVWANNSRNDDFVQTFQVNDLYIHDDYNHSEKLNDIALIYLSKTVTMGPYAKPICLPSKPMLKNYAAKGTAGFVSGWGLTEQKVKASRLLTTKILIFKNDECLRYIRRKFPNKQMGYLNKVVCAGTPPDSVLKLSDSQKHDSGGGLVFRSCRGYEEVFYLEGIVNWGVENGIGVYIRVHSYMDWINSII